MRKTDKVSLKYLENDFPEVKNILRYRELSKLEGTYLNRFISDVEGDILRGHFNQAGTLTGRYSSSDPNLQNIPSRSVEGKRIRSCFIAPMKCKMLIGDASQIEPRLIAHFSQDYTLLKIFNDGDDFHGIITRMAYSKDKFTSDERFVGKTIGLATIYGASAERLKFELFKYGVNMELTAVCTMRENILNYFSSVVEWINEFKRRVEYEGVITTIGGRRINFDPSIDCFNTKIQGSCADYLKLCLLNLAELKHKVVNIVHDEIIEYMPPVSNINDIVKCEKFSNELREVMEESVKLNNVPIKADIKIVSDWSLK